MRGSDLLFSEAGKEFTCSKRPKERAARVGTGKKEGGGQRAQQKQVLRAKKCSRSQGRQITATHQVEGKVFRTIEVAKGIGKDEEVWAAPAHQAPHITQRRLRLLAGISSKAHVSGAAGQRLCVHVHV